MQFLMFRSGEKKPERNGKGITTNVGKYLYWRDPMEVKTSHLTQAKQVQAYIAQLWAEIGRSALQQHIADIGAGLQHLVESKKRYREGGTSLHSSTVYLLQAEGPVCIFPW